MQDQLWEVWQRLSDAMATLEPALAKSASPVSRAAATAKALQALWPSASLYACHIVGQDAAATIALDAHGKPRLAWGEQVEASLAASDPPATEAHATWLALPPAMELPGNVLAVHPLVCRSQYLGAVGLAVPEATAGPTRSGLAALLDVLAGHIAPQLYLAKRSDEEQVLRQELQEESCLADVAELAGSVAHESNNFLNVVLLQLLILKPSVPESAQAQLEVIRRQANAFKAVIQQFQQLRDRRPASRTSADLNQAVCEVVRDCKDAAPELHMCGGPVLTSWPATALRRLVRLLLGAATTLFGRRSITLWTEATAELAMLRLQGLMPATRSAGECLQLQACQNLVRRLHGRVTWTDAGHIVVELPLAGKQGDSTH